MTASRPGAPAIELTRPELLWVVEQCGGDAWPYPLRRAHWPAETEEETVRHRTRAEEGLRARGLLEPGPAATLLAVGTAVAGWTVAVDLLHRSPTIPRAAVAVSDGGHAALLVSREPAGAPVRVAALAPDRLAPDRLAAAVVGVVPRGTPGTGPGLAVPVDALTTDPASPATARRTADRRAVDDLVAGATGWAEVGVAARAAGPSAAPGAAVRLGPLVTWLDGPHGRHRVGHDRWGGSVRTLVTPVDDAALVAAVTERLREAARSRPSGGRTA